MILKENNGQISIEFIFIISFIILLSFVTINLVSNENELNIAMSAARSGINEGILIDSIAIYPKSTFDDYLKNKEFLIHPNYIKFEKIIIRNSEFDSKYNKTRIQLQVYVSSTTVTEKNDQNALGDRINYNLRKSITTSFNTSHLSNALYNPAYSKNYIFTTTNVVWN
ncbi:hypothetical protein LJC03_01750 [Methanobrevibacter sp. OttesenSCG-928-I08]|nr:hypothetical protein [Methanobrevibacter sp. OttesenSCG-928-I08]